MNILSFFTSKGGKETEKREISSEHLQMNSRIRLVGDAIAFLGIAIPVIWLVFANYSPATWLTGWDNLHPEFDLLMNLRRAFYGVWQEHFGLGLLGGMAHAADITRILILMLWSSVLPLHMLRYAWVFSMLFIGPVGVYYLVTRGLLNKTENVFGITLAGIVAALFYLLNLATVQYFYTPFETFVGFYGFLPWLLFIIIQYLRSGGKRFLIALAVTSVLGASAFYVQTMFIVFVCVVGLFLVESVIKLRKEGVRRVFLVIGTLFAINAFWLLPSVYFSIISGKEVGESKINSIASPETKLFNEDTGTVRDIGLLKGFWFNYTDLGENGRTEYLLKAWRDHTDNKLVRVAGYTLFAAGIVGLILRLFSKKANGGFAFVALFILSYLMLATTNPPFGKLFELFVERVPLLKEAFRSVFTKWSVVMAFVTALGLGNLIFMLSNLSRTFIKYLAIIPATLLVVAMVVLTKPAFQGDLIMKSGRISIPQEYFELFDYFKGEPKESRIAFFPVQHFWGWNFYDWGYRGSGILWYGIEQPILDRAFDVWSKNNEGYYLEVSTALYGQDINLLRNVFDKYDVTYVLLDKNVIVPEQTDSQFKYQQTETMLKILGATKTWEKNALVVYALPKDAEGQGFVRTHAEFSVVEAANSLVRRDVIFANKGDYITRASLNDNLQFYPFTSLLEENLTNVIIPSSASELVTIQISKEVTDFQDKKLVIDTVSEGTILPIPAKVLLDGKNLTINFLPNVTIGSVPSTDLPQLSDLLVEMPELADEIFVDINSNIISLSQGEEKKVVLTLRMGSDIRVVAFNKSSHNIHNVENAFETQDMNVCWTREGTEGSIAQERSLEGTLTIETQDAAGCLSSQIDTFPLLTLLTVNVPYRSINGSRPSYCVIREGEYDCVNKEIFYRTAPSNEWNQVSQMVVLPAGGTYWLNLIARPPDAEGEGWSISYKSPSLISYPMVASVTFAERDLWADYKRSFIIALDSNVLNVSLTGKHRTIDFGRFGRVEPRNCDIFERGSIYKIVNDSEVQYGASDYASVCDYVPLSEELTTSSYILKFTGKGESGRGMKFYLFNKSSERNDLEILLPDGKFDLLFSVLSWPYLTANDYVLNVEGRSFGKGSTNVLSGVTIYETPLEWLSRWSIVNEKEKLPFTSYVNNRSYVKKGTHSYVVDVSNPQSGGITFLSQGNHDGWQGFIVSNKFQEIFPWLGGKKLEHTKLNSWANGWLLPEGEHTVVIVFWPQYLEYFGFLLLAVTATVLLVPVKRTANSSK